MTPRSVEPTYGKLAIWHLFRMKEYDIQIENAHQVSDPSSNIDKVQCAEQILAGPLRSRLD